MNKQKKLNKKGYVLVYAPNHKYSKTKTGWILEHILVAENILKRKLNNSEIIHHIDLDKQNNEPNNLDLFENNKSHISFHNKLRQFGMTRYVIEEIEKRKITNVTCKVNEEFKI